MKFFKSIKNLFTKGEKTLLQKQARAGIIILAVALIGLVVYFAIVRPAVNKVTSYVPELLEGEELYNNNIILIEKFRTRAEVSSIEIKNENEHYKLIAKDPGNAGTMFYIEGSEDITLNAQNLASVVTHSLLLVTNSPKLGTQDRVNERATDADLASYGLDEGSSPAFFEVKFTDGTSYKIIIGSKQPTGDGYYAMAEGRRNKVTDEDGVTTEYHVIYSLTTYVAADFMTQGSEALISTVVLPYFAKSIYQPSDFLIERTSDGEYKTVVRLHTLKAEEQTTAGRTYALDVPKGYVVEESTFSSYVLGSLEYLNAKKIFAYGEKVHDAAVYEKYGLDLDTERLKAGNEKCLTRVTFTLANVTPESTDFEGGTYTLYFGDTFYDADLGGDCRYAYSPYSETIFAVPTSDFGYVTWRPAKFISARMFFDNITSLDYLELIDDERDIRYTIIGNYLTYHVDVTKGSDTSVRILRDGAPLTFDVKPVIYRAGSYTQVKFEGEFENFRKLYYVLITREFAIDTDGGGEISAEPSRTINIKKTDRDTNESYTRFDKYGNPIVENGKTVKAIYDGGFIICHNVKLKTTGLSGGETVLNYDTAFYDEATGKFFLKEEDRADSYFKPKNYKINADGHISNWTYMVGKVEAEYVETLYTFKVYDVLYDYTDAGGNTEKRVNQTYCCVVPTVTTYTYRINSDGVRELIGQETEVSDGLYMRISQIDKLFNDSDKVVDGVEVDRFGAN